MLGIVSCHFVGHGEFIFPWGAITFNHLWLQLIGMGGGFGNNIFIMLSGYFLINSKGIKFHRLLNLWARMFFGAVVLYFVFVFSGLQPFTLKDALKNLMPVTHPQWWFASTYFVLYLIHPYLNRLLLSFTQEEYKKFLMTAVLGWYLVSMFTKPELGATEIIDFVCVYSIAGYLRLYAGNWGGKKYLMYAIYLIGAKFLYVVIIGIIGAKVSLVSKHAMYFYNITKPCMVLVAACLLLFFRDIKFPHSKIINTIASATFGVYLIHESHFMRPFLWHEIFTESSFPTFQDSPYFIPYSIAVIMSVYIACTILELLRSKIFRALSRGRLS